MPANGKSALRSGAARLLLGKRYIALLYVASLLLGFVATAGLSARIGHVLDRSLYSDRLVHGFDIAAWLELTENPASATGSQLPTSLLLSIAFLVFQIFLTGGILSEYLAAAKLSRARFYSACGENFWKLVRLAIFFVIVAGITAAILHGIRTAIGSAMEDSPHEHRAFALQLLVVVIEALILLWVRMWFDLAQTRAIANGEGAVRRSIGRAWSSARAGSLYGTYVALAVLMLLVAVVGGYFWWKVVPASAIFFSFLVLQLILFCLLAIRWWQRAAAAAWYDFYAPPPPPLVVLPEPVVELQVTIVEPPSPMLEPPTAPAT
jgi:hypothetical protein